MALQNNMSINSVPAETIVSGQTKFKGSIDTDKPLTIDGSFEGEIKSTSSVSVGENGTIDAKIECASFKLAGKGKGSLVCTGKTEFTANAEFEGDVTTKDIVMASGAKLEGNCKIGE